jgi:hypothetical protein
VPKSPFDHGRLPALNEQNQATSKTGVGQQPLGIISAQRIRRDDMSKFLSVAFFAGASAIAAFAPSQAEATSLPIWVGSFVTINGPAGFDQATFPSGPATFGTQSVSSADGSASVQSTPTPVPGITSIATAGVTATAAEANADLNYFFQIFAPGGLVVPTSVNIIASASLFSSAGATSSDVLTVNGTKVVNATSIDGNNNGAFTTTATISSVFTNTPTDFLIEMSVFAFAHPSGTATTFLDPFLFLDQSLVDLGYSIIVSPGIGNSLDVASATPLPAALPLFATGLGSLGLLGWRRKKKAKLLAA